MINLGLINEGLINGESTIMSSIDEEVAESLDISESYFTGFSDLLSESIALSPSIDSMFILKNILENILSLSQSSATTYEVNGDISDLIVIIDSILTGVPFVSISELLVISDSITYLEINNIVERIIVNPLLTDNSIRKQIILEYFNIVDLILVAIKGNISENIGLVSAIVGTIKQIELVTSNIDIRSSSLSSLRLFNILSEILSLIDSISFGIGMSIVEVVVLQDTVANITSLLSMVSESIISSSSLSTSYINIISLSDSVSIISNDSNKFNIKELLEDTLILTIPTASGQDTYLSYLLSPETMSVSNYDNYNFDGCAKFNGKYLFYSKTGLYEYGGKLDEATPITSYIQTVAYNFNSSNLKQIPAIYLGVSNDDSLILKVRVDGKGEIIYKLNKKTDNLATQKIDIGKGLIGRYFQFEIITDAPNFNLESIEFFPVALKRKL